MLQSLNKRKDRSDMVSLTKNVITIEVTSHSMGQDGNQSVGEVLTTTEPEEREKGVLCLVGGKLKRRMTECVWMNY